MEGHALFENMSYGRTCLQVGTFCRIMCFTGRCLTREQVLLEGMSYERTCIIAGHILQEHMSYKNAHLTEG